MKTVGEAGKAVEKSINFIHTCLYEPCFQNGLEYSRFKPGSEILILPMLYYTGWQGY